MTLIRPTYLMCPPTFFGVDYVINPWMQGHIGDVDRAVATEQWEVLRRILFEEFGARVETIDPIEGLPDMVFTANAALVHDGRFVPARFRPPERRGEEIHFERWLADYGLTATEVDGFNEGAGDLLFSEATLYAASGFRTEAATHRKLSESLGITVVSLELVNPSFYHLDTCFCPLPGGRLLWYPGAFSPGSVAQIEAAFPQDHRFPVSDEDAARFACNSVAVPGRIVLNDCNEECGGWLESQGFRVYRTPLSEFMKAGGAAKCLTLRIDSGSV